MKKNKSNTSVLEHFREDVSRYIDRLYGGRTNAHDYYRGKCIHVYADELIDRWEAVHGVDEIPDVGELLAGHGSWREVHDAGLSPKGDEYAREVCGKAGMRSEELQEWQIDLLYEAADDALNWTIWNIEDVFRAYMPWDLPGRLFFSPYKFFHYRRKRWK